MSRESYIKMKQSRKSIAIIYDRSEKAHLKSDDKVYILESMYPLGFWIQMYSSLEINANFYVMHEAL